MLTPKPAMEDHHHTLSNQPLKPQEMEEQSQSLMRPPHTEELKLSLKKLQQPHTEDKSPMKTLPHHMVELNH